MIDWKIIGASFAALVVISSVMLGGFGFSDFFSDLFDNTGDLLGSSPFGGFFDTPTTKNKEVEINLFPEEYVIKPDSTFNITIGSVDLSEFKGEVRVYYQNNTMILKEDNSPLVVGLELQELELPEITFSKLLIENTHFEVKPNITTENGNMEIENFLGTVIVQEDKINFKGNVSKLKLEIAGFEFEMV